MPSDAYGSLAQRLGCVLVVIPFDTVDEAIALARTKLDDKDGGVRQYALSALARLHAGDYRDVAQKMLNDPAENVRLKAQKLIAANP